PGIDSPPGLLLAQQDGRRISFLTGDGPRVREAWHMLLPDETPAGSVVGFPAVREKGEPTRLVHAGADANVRVIASGRRTVEIPFTAGPVASPLAVRLRASELPSILFVDGQPRLNCLRAGSPQRPVETAWSCPAHGWTTPYVPAVKTLGVPHVADI